MRSLNWNDYWSRVSNLKNDYAGKKPLVFNSNSLCCSPSTSFLRFLIPSTRKSQVCLTPSNCSPRLLQGSPIPEGDSYAFAVRTYRVFMAELMIERAAFRSLAGARPLDGHQSSMMTTSDSLSREMIGPIAVALVSRSSPNSMMNRRSSCCSFRFANICLVLIGSGAVLLSQTTREFASRTAAARLRHRLVPPIPASTERWTGPESRSSMRLASQTQGG